MTEYYGLPISILEIMPKYNMKCIIHLYAIYIEFGSSRLIQQIHVASQTYCERTFFEPAHEIMVLIT